MKNANLMKLEKLGRELKAAGIGELLTGGRSRRRAVPGLAAHRDKACGTACRFCKANPDEARERWAGWGR